VIGVGADEGSAITIELVGNPAAAGHGLNFKRKVLRLACASANEAARQATQ